MSVTGSGRTIKERPINMSVTGSGRTIKERPTNIRLQNSVRLFTDRPYSLKECVFTSKELLILPFAVGLRSIAGISMGNRRGLCNLTDI